MVYQLFVFLWHISIKQTVPQTSQTGTGHDRYYAKLFWRRGLDVWANIIVHQSLRG